jgi:integrase/recombinase XerD
MQMKPTIVTYLDTRRKKKSGRYPFKIRVTFCKKQEYYSTGFDLSKDEYDALKNDTKFKQLPIKLKRQLQDVKIRCDAQLVKANEVANKIPVFNFSVFERRFLTGKHSRDSVYLYYENTIKKQKEEARVGTASNYSTSMNSLKKFSPKLLFTDITVELLRDYESWLLAKGRSKTTVGIYLRPLRAILNQAIEDGEFPRELYPFTKRRYQIPTSRTFKKALTLNEIGKIARFQAEPGTWWETARDIFMFSYFANGINIKDILRLRYSNVDEGYIRYVRAKTERTNRSNGIQISFYLTKELSEIIIRIGSKKKNPENFIFPVLGEGLTPSREMATVQQFTQMVNKYLYKIAEEVGIDKKVTTYYARHSFATVLKRSGVSPLFISEALGHSSLKTTEIYLDYFEDDRKKEIGEILRNY